MNRLIYFIIIAFFLSECSQNPANQDGASEAGRTSLATDSTTAETPQMHAGEAECNKSESLLYQKNGFSTYTEDKIRGKGIVSLHLDINDRLDIYDEDGSVFGELVLNEDMTYFTLKMPQKIVARYVVPHYDLATFDFDAEDVNADKDYLFIYVNKERRKVRKDDVDFKYAEWTDYLKDNTVTLKECNLLKDQSGMAISTSRDQVFIITEVKGDLINIKSSRDCSGDVSDYKDMQGWVKWRSDEGLIIDFVGCG